MQYSGKENPLLEQSIDARVQDLINLISNKYVSKGSEYKQLDFAVIAQYFTMDVLTDVAFGEPFGYLANDEDMYEYIQTIRGFMPVLELQTNSPFTNMIMSSPLVKALLAPTAKDRTGMGPVIRYKCAPLLRYSAINKCIITGSRKKSYARGSDQTSYPEKTC